MSMNVAAVNEYRDYIIRAVSHGLYSTFWSQKCMLIFLYSSRKHGME